MSVSSNNIQKLKQNYFVNQQNTQSNVRLPDSFLTNVSYLSIIGAKNNIRGDVSSRNNLGLSSALQKYYSQESGTTNNADFITEKNIGQENNSESYINDFRKTAGNILGKASGTLKNGLSTLKGMLASAFESFLSQLRGKTNKNEDAGNGNGNCGPACLAMIARAFGILEGDAGNANEQIEQMRKLMGAENDENSWTSMGQLHSAAEKLGLNAKLFNQDGSMSKLTSELKKGNRVIVRVNSQDYGIGGDSSHFVVVTDIKDGKLILQDPSQQKPIVVDKKQFEAAMTSRGNWMLSIGA